MSFDLRLPMGLMFSFMGAILAAFGMATNANAALYAKSLGINVNLWWGVGLLVFGQAMYYVGRRAQLRLDPPPAQPTRTFTNPRLRRIR